MNLYLFSFFFFFSYSWNLNKACKEKPWNTLHTYVIVHVHVFRAKQGGGKYVDAWKKEGESFVLEWSSFGTPKQKVLRISILENARESAFFRDRPLLGSPCMERSFECIYWLVLCVFYNLLSVHS